MVMPEASNVLRTYTSLQKCGSNLVAYCGNHACSFKLSQNKRLNLFQNQFLSGDNRANENPGLQAMHTIWFREHNRLADLVATADPSLDDEAVFQESLNIEPFISSIARNNNYE